MFKGGYIPVSRALCPLPFHQRLHFCSSRLTLTQFTLPLDGAWVIHPAARVRCRYLWNSLPQDVLQGFSGRYQWIMRHITELTSLLRSNHELNLQKLLWQQGTFRGFTVACCF